MPYTDLQYQNARLKASHNSYERKEDFHEQLLWDASQPWEGGCRALECDIHLIDDGSQGTSVDYFMIGHDSPGPHPFADYLGYLLSWHANHSGHDPVFLVIDNKNTGNGYFAFPLVLDRYLKEWFDTTLLFKPSDFTHDLVNLRGVSLRGGWPTIGQLAGKFIFCLSGTPEWKSFYADNMDVNTLCFTDFDVADTSDVAQLVLPANRVFISLNLFTDHFKLWLPSVAALHKFGFITRGYVLNSEELWDKGLSTELNMLATDEITGKSWACVGTDPFSAL
jgi:hypothetical protein